MRTLLVLITCCALGACGGRPSPGGPDEDGGAATRDGSVGDAARRDGGMARDGSLHVDGGLLQCSGPGRMVLNGTSVPVTVSGTMLFLNCCEAAQFVFEPLGPNAPRIVVMWSAMAGPATIPFEVDLAAPPDGIGVQVLSGCGDPPEYCPNPTDTLSTGLEGTLAVDGTIGLGYTMTLCLRGFAPAGETHPVLRTIELWAEGVVAPWPED